MVKFSRGDVDLDKIIISLNELSIERLGQPLLVAGDSFQDEQTLLRANMDSQFTSESVLTEDDKLLKDLGAILLSIQGTLYPCYHLAVSPII